LGELMAKSLNLYIQEGYEQRYEWDAAEIRVASGRTDLGGSDYWR